MVHRFSNVLRNFGRNEDGNIFVLFGASAIPLLLVMGGAVDLARYTRYKAELSNAVDSAALALARKADDFASCTEVGAECPDASEFAADFVNSFGVGDETLTVDDITAYTSNNGFRVEADGAMDTLFLPLGELASIGGGIMSMDVDIEAEVTVASNRLELALVLDNTGSMNCVNTVTATCASNWSAPPSDSRIVALKSAANALVTTLMGGSHGDPNEIKIAVVPFEGMVNVASAVPNLQSPPSWVEWNATTPAAAQYDGINLSPYSGSLRRSHGWLFNRLSAEAPVNSVKWAGCVEMRAGSYELTVNPPDPTIPNSLFVPFFWPDEPDFDTEYANNYLQDRVTGTDSTRQRSRTKYNTTTDTVFHSGRMDVEGLLTPYQYGPNKGCPRPIKPLTPATMTGATPTGMNAVKAEINAMIAYWATGTFIPTGLVWGWHVLAPGEPYTEGVGPTHDDYAETIKAIVLLTDGENEVTGGGPYGVTAGNDNLSGYSAYNYVLPAAGAQNRLGSSLAAAITNLNAKTTTLCGNVKTAGIRLYTVTFGGSANQTLMSDCASADEDGNKLHYHAPTPDSLAAVFDAIAEDLEKIHLSM